MPSGKSTFWRDRIAMKVLFRLYSRHIQQTVLRTILKNPAFAATHGPHSLVLFGD